MRIDELECMADEVNIATRGGAVKLSGVLIQRDALEGIVAAAGERFAVESLDPGLLIDEVIDQAAMQLDEVMALLIEISGLDKVTTALEAATGKGEGREDRVTA